MFKRLQIKMTAYYSSTLILIILCINFATYFILNSQNEKQLGQETLSIINNISNSEWFEDESDEMQKYEESEKYEEREEKHNMLEIPENANKIKTPKSLKLLYFYYIYSNSGELLQYSVPSQQLHNFLLAESKEPGPELQPKTIKTKNGENRVCMSTVKFPIYKNGNKIGYVFAGRDITVALETIEMLLVIIAVTSVLGMIISIIAGYFIAERAVRPVKEAFESKQRFIADASHELRTPVSVISLSSEVLQRELPEDSFLYQVSRDISDETARMASLVENMLLLARADSKRLSIQKDQLDLSVLIEKACSSLKYLAKEKDITIRNNQAQTLELIGDSKLISSLIFILVENAIKYTPQNGIVTIESGHAKLNNKPDVFFSVIDTGIGIRESELKGIFDRFYRVDSSRTKKVSGHGLGLSIAKEIVVNHNGIIDVKSQVGKGSSFTVILPGV